MDPKAKIALFTAFLALGGSLTGVWLGAHFTRSTWVSQARFDEKKSILDKRIQLIERTAVLIRKSAIASRLRDSRTVKVKLAEVENIDVHRRSVKSGRLASVTDLRTMMAEIDQLDRELGDLDAEFETVMILDDFFFGPETGKVVDAIRSSTPWWESLPRHGTSLIDALRREMPYGITDQVKK